MPFTHANTIIKHFTRLIWVSVCVCVRDYPLKLTDWRNVTQIISTNTQIHKHAAHTHTLNDVSADNCFISPIFLTQFINCNLWHFINYSKQLHVSCFSKPKKMLKSFTKEHVRMFDMFSVKNCGRESQSRCDRMFHCFEHFDILCVCVS